MAEAFIEKKGKGKNGWLTVRGIPGQSGVQSFPLHGILATRPREIIEEIADERGVSPEKVKQALNKGKIVEF